MAADVSSVARMLRGEAGKRGAVARPEMVTMDLLGGCGGGGDAAAAGQSGSGGEDEVVDLEVKVPVGWERRLDLLSGKMFLTRRHQGVQDGHQDLHLTPPATAAAASATSAAVCTLDMVRSALERAAAVRSAVSTATSSSSSASTSSSSSSVGKRHRSPPASTASAENPSMRAAACPSCLTYVLIVEADPRCPRCSGKVPPLAGKPSGGAATAVAGSGKKPRIDLNAAADESE